MTDEFLQELQSSWRGLDVAIADVRTRLRRQRWRPHLALAYELLSTAAVMGVGAWFALRAMKLDSLLLAMSGGILLVAAPALAVAAWLARRDSLRWDEETPESVLASGLKRADASLKALRLGRVHLAVVGVFAAILWTSEFAGLISSGEFLVRYTLICAGMAAVYLPWIAWREKRVKRERAECRQLLDELHAADAMAAAERLP